MLGLREETESYRHSDKVPSLEEICVNSMAKSFGRFFFAFTVSKNDDLQRSFTFLQRKYSVQFLKALHKDKNLKEEYFELFLSKHLTYFKDKWLINSRYVNSMEEIFHRLPNLVRIRIQTHLESDDILKNISKFCPKIIEIVAHGSSVTDIGLNYLYASKNGTIPCPNLRSFYLCDSCVTDEGVKDLIRNVPSLETLSCDTDISLLLYSIHEENLRKSGEIQYYNLTDLVCFLDEDILRDYPDILKVCLTICPKLYDLSCTIFEENEFSAFTSDRLRYVSFDICKPDRKLNFDNFLKMKIWKLTFLEIGNCTMSISLLKTHCPNLKKILLDCVNFTDHDYLNSNFEFLTRCVFNDIDHKAICVFLTSSPKLESITVGPHTLSSDLKNHILLWCKNPCAKDLEFEKMNVLDIEFLTKVLLNCPSLEMMTIYIPRKYLQNEMSRKEYEERREMLRIIVASLPNKPELQID